jgi:LytS/YehU family sensor histidine kinase
MKTRIAYWACQIGGWGAYVAVGMSMAARQAGWQAGIVVGYALFFLYSIALTDLLRREIRRRGWPNVPYGFLRVLGSAVALATVQTFLVFAVSLAFQGRASGFLHMQYVAATWVSVSGADCMWALFYVGLTSKRRFEEKEIHLQLSLREAELRALEAQLNPHFLFNALNSVRALVIENPAQAQDMITRLANLLRYNLHRDLNHKVPLGVELEMVADYLALESVRFEDRLRIESAVDPAAAQVLVPPMLLQTLAENALKHGIAHLPAGGEIAIRARIEGERLVLEVENTGQLADAGAQATQLGLKNARERLRILFGDDASLVLTSGGGRVTATVVIPRMA